MSHESVGAQVACTARANRSAFRAAVRFIWEHRVHVAILLPMIPIVTAVHEAAHAGMVLALGGTVTGFTFLPSDGLWGSVRYTLDGGSQVHALIAAAPYLFWAACAAMAALTAGLRWPRRFGTASTVYVWLYFVPMCDVANAALPYTFGRDNDFVTAFGPPTPLMTAALLGLGALSAVAGYPLQRALYRDRALTQAPYALLVGLTLIALMCLILV